jgi:chromosome segregation ATPase
MYAVRFTPTQPGSHVIHITWRGQPIRHSPVAVTVQGSHELAPELLELQKKIQEAGSQRQKLIRANLKIEHSLDAQQTRIEEVERAVEASRKQHKELSRETSRLDQEFRELTRVNRTLEEEAAAVSVEVTEWRKEAEKKFTETHARLAREVKAKDNLEKVMTQMRAAFDEEIKARTRLELLKRELSAQCEDLKENIQELQEILLKLENDYAMTGEICKVQYLH